MWRHEKKKKKENKIQKKKKQKQKCYRAKQQISKQANASDEIYNERIEVLRSIESIANRKRMKNKRGRKIIIPRQFQPSQPGHSLVVHAIKLALYPSTGMNMSRCKNCGIADCKSRGSAEREFRFLLLNLSPLIYVCVCVE